MKNLPPRPNTHESFTRRETIAIRICKEEVILTMMTVVEKESDSDAEVSET